MPVFEPATFATPEDLIQAEVAEVEAELKRIDARLASLAWGGPYARPRRGNETWSDVAFNAAATRDSDDGGALAREVLHNKREVLLLELGRLRERLVGQDKGDRGRRGWG